MLDIFHNTAIQESFNIEWLLLKSCCPCNPQRKAGEEKRRGDEIINELQKCSTFDFAM